MKKIFDIFKIKKEERVSALVALIIACALNALTVIKYHSQFSQITDNYHKLFVKTFHVAGFDPLTYSIVSHWDTEYNVYRHPLLAFFMYIPNQINQGLMMLTGINCVQFVVGAILVFCAFYSFIFLYRIFREVIGTERFDANLLSAFYFSFAYVMVSAMVPDHFIMSMIILLCTLYITGVCMKKGRQLTIWQTILLFVAYVMVSAMVPDHFIMSMIILLCTLYITGVCMKKGRQLTIWQTILLFVFTAGVSLNNGLKTYLAALFTNGRKFFSIKYFLIGVILPAALMWAFARWEYRTFVWPKEMARHEAKMKKNKEATAKIYQQYRDSTGVKDSAKVEAAVRKIIKDKAHAKYVRDHKQIWNKNTGKPIAKGEFMNWTDKTTSRSQTLVENFFGESIMLHQQNLLGDVLRNRPVIVKYQSAVNYVVEACIVVLFLLGILPGRKSKFLWLTLTFFLMDAALHIGLGFGINEVYIMTAHYMYALPVAIAFLALKAKGKSRKWAFRGLMLAITLYLWISNGYLLVGYMLG